MPDINSAIIVMNSFMALVVSDGSCAICMLVSIACNVAFKVLS